MGRALLPSLATLLEALVTSIQEGYAAGIITGFDLTDQNTRTKESSPCRDKLQPPCYGFGSWNWDDIDEFLAEADKRYEEVELNFVFSVLSSRVFMRIFNRLMEQAKKELPELLEKYSYETPDPSQQKRVSSVGWTNKCLQKAKLPNGSINE